MPPFSVLDARGGDWQRRKRAWLALGIKSEIGRNSRCFNIAEWAETKGVTGAEKGNTSIFDPCLCEIAYRWFCPDGGTILDPFAGGSVRGVVASLLGYQYHGIELRQEQVDANREQAAAISNGNFPAWFCGDALDLLDGAPDACFIFTCPPYGDLEVYSDDPRDLSVMAAADYHTFLGAYRRIVLRCARKLKPGSFACFVVGDFRDKRTGNLRGFPTDTVNAFRECGMELYNEAVLISPCGSLPVRTSAQFEKSRKLGKSHQNLLVFRK